MHRSDAATTVRPSSTISARTSRARWAALGAAVAVTIGSGSLMSASASIDSGTKAVFVPVAPCRLVDTRPGADQVGPRSAPLGPGEVYTQQVTGTNGNCTIPADAVSVSLNVTAVGGTASSYFTVFPADAPQPLAANLNWVAGAPPTPNKVDVGLSATGAIKIFNYQGSVSLIVDIAGYYVDHTHDDRYYTKPQTDAAIAVGVAGAQQEKIGVTTRTAFTPPATFGVFGQVSVTTTKAGRLHISLHTTGGYRCTGGSNYDAWLTVDGAFVAGSQRLLSTIVVSGGFDNVGFPDLAIEGVTTTAVAAGTHALAIRMACTSGSGLSNSSSSTSGVVTVLP